MGLESPVGRSVHSCYSKGALDSQILLLGLDIICHLL